MHFNENFGREQTKTAAGAEKNPDLFPKIQTRRIYP